jgi:hypothetical protein
MSSAIPAPGKVRSSMKTLVIRLLMIEGLIGVYDFDHSTTPEVVRISKVSNILPWQDMLESDTVGCAFCHLDLDVMRTHGHQGGPR